MRIPGRRFTFGRSLVAAVVIAAALVALIAWQLTSGGGNQRAKTQALAQTTSATTTHTTPVRTAPIVPALARLTVAATRGACWLSVHVGSAAGAFVWQGTLEPGRTVRFVSRRLWLRIGAPWNVDARLNGKPAVLPARTGDYVATPHGVTATSLRLNRICGLRRVRELEIGLGSFPSSRTLPGPPGR